MVNTVKLVLSLKKEKKNSSRTKKMSRIISFLHLWSSIKIFRTGLFIAPLASNWQIKNLKKTLIYFLDTALSNLPLGIFELKIQEIQEKYMHQTSILAKISLQTQYQQKRLKHSDRFSNCTLANCCCKDSLET